MSDLPEHLDIDTWPRRHHFEFFRHYEQPCFNICVRVDVTAAYELKTRREVSFFSLLAFAALAAANETTPFRYRLRSTGDRASVLVHRCIHGGSTVLREDQTFGFSYFAFERPFEKFAANVAAGAARVLAGKPRLEDQPERDDLVYFSVLPWLDFTSFSHARPHTRTDSVPRVVFGKHCLREGARSMPVSIEVHHALMDGLHVAHFVAAFQDLLNRPESLLAASPG